MKRAKPPGEGEKKMTYFMSLKRGMQELVDSSVAFMGPENIALSSEVRRVARGRVGYDVSIGAEKMAFDAVVLTTPSYVTAELIRDMAPSLAIQLSAIEWSSTATMSLAFKGEDISSGLPGFGFIVPRIEGRRINAATWSSLKWPLRAPSDSILVRSFVGGGHDEDLVSYPDEDLLSIVLEELKEIAGIAARPLFSKIYRWERSMPRYTVGHLERIAAMDEALKAHPGLHLIGSSYRGIGIGDCVRSGFEAAEGIVASMRP
jgi:oxygen-dependent protoporphyrinogen oxidase